MTELMTMTHGGYAPFQRLLNKLANSESAAGDGPGTCHALEGWIQPGLWARRRSVS